ncbi:MAG: alpha-galactosidase [Jatrophihabitans sp.]|uniref:alpha-galactosidase n=1 Tax=Jatrophihabitans sp. TaxID=1932789 RepID=UPI003911B339
MIFPAAGAGARVVLDTADATRLAVVRWLGWSPDGEDPGGVEAAAAAHRGAALLREHSRGSLARPGLRGHRLATERGGAARDIAGRSWSTAFTPDSATAGDDHLVVTAADVAAGLELRTELEALPGGALRIRHVLTNAAADPYVLDGLEVTVPIPDTCVELLDFTGRHMGERSPQRQRICDGLWSRESRGGRPGLDAASMLLAGTAGFGFATGEVIGLAVATSGNSVLTLHRSGAEGPTLGGGELLLPGEVVLREGESYATPWVVVTAALDGLDSIAAALHTWERSLPAHPSDQPVTLNVWEAVYFDHDLDRLTALADRAARIGVERFVLDDGWFRHRRNATAGLGDWFVDEDVWPAGLSPLIEHVRRAGMEFGLWFEPEMINPDSDLYRAHPDWVLAAGTRLPGLQRNQLVLDLTNPAAYAYIEERLGDVLGRYDIGYVKWDHNRDLVEAGSGEHDWAPAAHEQNAAFYRLLEVLRLRHPHVVFESCASGGGRIDLGVIERVQRVWTSDMTDALSRQQIQRWTAQFVAPEYLGAHISSPVSHQTGRTLPLDFRAATALFGAFGIEWDLTAATDDELNRLAEWVAIHKQWRPMLHSGRVVRIETSDDAVIAHGVLAADRSAALLAHVQLDESGHNRGVTLRVPGLDRQRRYRCTWAGPVDRSRVTGSPQTDPAGPTGGAPVSGAALAGVGLWLPRRRPEQVLLISLKAI